MKVYAYSRRLMKGKVLHHCGDYGLWAVDSSTGEMKREKKRTPRSFYQLAGDHFEGYVDIPDDSTPTTFFARLGLGYFMAGHVDGEPLPEPGKLRKQKAEPISSDPEQNPEPAEKVIEAASPPRIQRDYDDREGYMLIFAQQFHSASGKVYAHCGEYGIWCRETGSGEWEFERENWSVGYNKLTFMGAWYVQIPADALKHRTYVYWDLDRPFVGFTTDQMIAGMEANGRKRRLTPEEWERLKDIVRSTNS